MDFNSWLDDLTDRIRSKEEKEKLVEGCRPTTWPPKVEVRKDDSPEDVGKVIGFDAEDDFIIVDDPCALELRRKFREEQWRYFEMMRQQFIVEFLSTGVVPGESPAPDNKGDE